MGRWTHHEGAMRLRTPEYNAWASMISRCENPRTDFFKLYEWGRRLGLPPKMIRKRVTRGWSVAETLGFAPPPSRRGRR